MFAIIDCNNFYASCERLFRPDLRGKPIVVLSNNDGCCIARSDEAKALGISMGAPFFEIKQLCYKNRVIVFSSNYTLYGDMSHRVMSVIKNAWPEVEVYSIDEAFLDLRRLPIEQIDSFCLELQKQIFQYTGITTSIGIGSTKTLAKAANYLSKRVYKTPTFNINKNLHDSLKKISIADIWGIGRGWYKKLSEIGIKSAYDFANIDDIFLRKMSNVVLTRTALELRGVICNELESFKPRENIMSSKSFGTMQTELSDIENAISCYCKRAVEKLRGQKLVATKISVFIISNKHRKDLPQYYNSIETKFIIPTDDIRLITKTAKNCLSKIFKPGISYKKAGIELRDLVANNVTQFDLFAPCSQNFSQENKVMDTLELINSKYGRDTISLAAEGFQKMWKMRSQMKSPAYTTRWSELPIVLAK